MARRRSCKFLKIKCRIIFLLLLLTPSNLLIVDYILWGNRLKGFRGYYCLISVDGTDFQVYRQKGSYKFWYGYKFKKPGVRYEVAISIISGDIVWINGPFPCGFYNDIKIFRQGLKNMLEDGERVEVDDGYLGEAPRYVLCPKAIRSKFMSKEKKYHRG